MNSAAPRRVIIVGLGVMGGSVAKTLKRRAPRTVVFGIDPDDESAALASRDGVVRAHALDDCDLDGAVVVFAAPLDVTASLVRDTAGAWSRAALATDPASLKVPVVEAARPAAQPAPAQPPAFVGAHPMCGSERSGYAAARADLFDGADVWLCPEHDGAPLARAQAFWRLLGGRPRTIAAADHDRLMARASHLPQLLSVALAQSLDDAGIARDVLGPGGRDMTRLAGSSPSMWLPLLEAAHERDARALGALEERIGSVRRMLEEGDLAALARFMERGRRWASRTD
ncbi:MAG: prephenate dehydrogenase/arogenate dehydrogenase family protein [Gemmatimonadetes bacterium]|nr:prephenate dehydrogenase/arogenate dehydrogenase family protein [Gemmatimonadota bacterium]